MYCSLSSSAIKCFSKIDDVSWSIARILRDIKQENLKERGHTKYVYKEQHFDLLRSVDMTGTRTVEGVSERGLENHAENILY